MEASICWQCGEPSSGTTPRGNTFCERHPCQDCWSCDGPATLRRPDGTPYCDGRNPTNGELCGYLTGMAEMT